MLKSIQSLWELPYIAHFCQLFQTELAETTKRDDPRRLPSFTVNDLERAIARSSEPEADDLDDADEQEYVSTSLALRKAAEKAARGSDDEDGEEDSSEDDEDNEDDEDEQSSSEGDESASSGDDEGSSKKNSSGRSVARFTNERAFDANAWNRPELEFFDAAKRINEEQRREGPCTATGK